MLPSIYLKVTPYRTAIVLSYTTLQNTVCFAKCKTWNSIAFTEEDEIKAICEQIGISQQQKGVLLSSFIIFLVLTRPLYGVVI